MLFNEYEIVIETEPPEQVNKDSTKTGIEYCDVIKPIDHHLEKDLIKLDEEKVDEYFSTFRERIDREPEQV